MDYNNIVNKINNSLSDMGYEQNEREKILAPVRRELYEAIELDNTINENKALQPSHADLVEWICEHEFVHEDILNYYDLKYKDDLFSLSYNQIIDWVSGHNTLYQDLVNHFNIKPYYIIDFAKVIDFNTYDLFDFDREEIVDYWDCYIELSERNKSFNFFVASKYNDCHDNYLVVSTDKIKPDPVYDIIEQIEDPETLINILNRENYSVFNSKTALISYVLNLYHDEFRKLKVNDIDALKYLEDIFNEVIEKKEKQLGLLETTKTNKIDR